MRSDKTRAAGASVLLALGGLLATLILLAGPAGADTTSVGPNASNGSVSSGAAIADNGSTASGNSVAINGSVSSGCAFADNVSTASGGACAPATTPTTSVVVVTTPTGGNVPTASVATPSASRSLAFTGSSTGPLAGAAMLSLLLGGLMVVVSSDRRRAPAS